MLSLDQFFQDEGERNPLKPCGDKIGGIHSLIITFIQLLLSLLDTD